MLSFVLFQFNRCVKWHLCTSELGLVGRVRRRRGLLTPTISYLRNFFLIFLGGKTLNDILKSFLFLFICLVWMYFEKWEKTLSLTTSHRSKTPGQSKGGQLPLVCALIPVTVSIWEEVSVWNTLFWVCTGSCVCVKDNLWFDTNYSLRTVILFICLFHLFHTQW